MKRILLIAIILPLALSCVAQLRVVDRSERREPSWVNGLERGYIIVVGTGPSIQVAQENALNMVKERIVSTVAENVQTSSEMRIEESTINNISSYLENFATTTTTTSGPVPFLQGISLSRVDEFYWEKVENRADRSIRFNYHIKYPFPETEIWKLVTEFKKRDNELAEQLDELYDAVDKVRSIEEIDRNISELRTLSEYFMDARRDKALLGISRYRNLYNSLELVELESGLGELKYTIRLGNRSVHTSRRPQLRSECARVTSTENKDDYTLIKYDFFNCYEDPENHILVSYRFGNTTLSRPFYFDITADKASIHVSDPFRFASVSKSNGIIENAVLDITVVSRYQAPFTIQKVDLEIQGNPPITIDNIGQSYVGKGNHSLKLNINQPINVEQTSTSTRRVAMLSGYIHFKSDITGEVKTYRIYNHRYTTDW